MKNRSKSYLEEQLQMILLNDFAMGSYPDEDKAPALKDKKSEKIEGLEKKD